MCLSKCNLHRYGEEAFDRETKLAWQEIWVGRCTSNQVDP
jgi:hypothetical protein